MVSAAGGGVDIATDLATKSLNAAKQNTITLARQAADAFPPPTSGAPLADAITTQKQAQRALNQVTSKGMKAVGALGNAATFVGGVIEAYKLNGKLGEHEDDWSRNVRKAIASADNASENAFAAYKAGNITFEQLRQRLLDIKYLLDRTQSDGRL